MKASCLLLTEQAGSRRVWAHCLSLAVQGLLLVTAAAAVRMSRDGLA